MATGVFGLNKIYKKQTDNIEERNFSQWPESATHGYLGNGFNGSSYLASVERIEFSTETASNPGNNLGLTVEYSAAVQSSFYGYFSGGVVFPGGHPAGARYCNVNRLDFSNETVNQPGKNLSNITTYHGSVSGVDYGYYAGGSTTTGITYNPWGPVSGYPENYTTVVHRLDFYNETVSQPGKNLPTNAIQIGSVSNKSYGYFGGGNYIGVGYVSYIARLDFSNETLTYGLTLPTSKELSAGTQNPSYGYFAGGRAPEISTITRLDFDTEVVSNPGNNLPQTNAAAKAAQDSSNSYIMGGASGGIRSTITRLDFSTETVSTPGKNLTSPRANYSSVTAGASISRQNKSTGYFAGGFTGSYTNAISKISFSDDTVSVSGTPLSQAVEGLSAVSSNSYGYFAGGLSASTPTIVRSSSLDRIDYLNDSRITSTVPQLQRNKAAATSSSSYGYFGGGFGEPGSTTLSSFCRLDFANETINTPSKNLPTANASMDAISNYYFGYYVGGNISTINRLDFFNETVSQPGNNLPNVREALAATSNNVYGYFGGGVVPPSTFISTISRLDFSTEIVSDPGNNLPSARSTFAATSSSLYGYFSGGNNGSAFISNISRLDFSTEILSNTTNLPVINNGMCAENDSN